MQSFQNLTLASEQLHPNDLMFALRNTKLHDNTGFKELNNININELNFRKYKVHKFTNVG